MLVIVAYPNITLTLTLSLGPDGPSPALRAAHPAMFAVGAQPRSCHANCATASRWLRGGQMLAVHQPHDRSGSSSSVTRAVLTLSFLHEALAHSF